MNFIGHDISSLFSIEEVKKGLIDICGPKIL